MKKLVAFAVAVYVLVSGVVSLAEQNAPAVEGEWYVLREYSNNRMPISVADNNTYVVQFKNGDRYTFKDDGAFMFESEGYSEEIVTEYAEPSDSIRLYYDIQDEEIYGYILLDSSGEWSMYEISNGKTMFLLGGKVIPYGGKQSGEYMYSKNMLYITNDDTYIRGSVEWHGQDAFIYFLDEEEYTVQFGDTEVNYGTPFMVFISTTVRK